MSPAWFKDGGRVILQEVCAITNDFVEMYDPLQSVVTGHALGSWEGAKAAYQYIPFHYRSQCKIFCDPSIEGEFIENRTRWLSELEELRKEMAQRVR